MDLHILGICGTFMAGIALLARAQGHSVSGSDANAWPPMSTQLSDLGVRVLEGYDPACLDSEPDRVLVGNALSRGNPVVEAVLDRGIPYTSGPQWLAESVLSGRHVLAVAGTHGKTTTSAMLAWILDQAGLQPGFLIGGMPRDFGVSARLGAGPHFVVEADEYDTAFFDKRSKFVHYRPRTLVMNNLEYDHADIFPDLAAIQRQFHHLVRTVPGSGCLLVNGTDSALAEVLAMGCWTPVQTLIEGDWTASAEAEDSSRFRVQCRGQDVGSVRWELSGRHNMHNALAAIAAAHHVGVDPQQACSALSRFQGVKRRQELRGQVGGVRVLDDFAHHPTAIATTLAGLRARTAQGRLIAVVEMRSNSMKMGVFQERLAPAFAHADAVVLFQGPALDWSLEPVAGALGPRARLCLDIDAVVDAVCAEARAGDTVVVMSNGAFGGIHERLLAALGARDGSGP